MFIEAQFMIVVDVSELMKMDVQLTLIATALAVTLATIYYFIRKHLNYWKDRGIPCETPNLFYGNVKGFQKTKHVIEIFQEYYEKFKGTGPFCGFFMFQTPGVLALDIELIRRILQTDFANFTNRNIYYNEEVDPLSATLLVLQDDKWRNLRQKVTPTFTSGKMKFMFPTAVKVAHNLIDAVNEKVATSSIVDMEDFFTRYTMDLIGLCAFGIDCNSLKNRESEFRRMGLKAVTQLRHTGLVFGFQMSFQNLARKFGMRWNTKDVEDFFMRVVGETVSYREKNKIERNDFINLLIELKNRPEDAITFNQMVTQSFSFFKAGFENATATLTWAIYHIAKDAAIQEKARAEVESVMEKHKGEFTYETMMDMQYIEQIIAETLRLYSITPILIRRAENDYVVPGHPDYVIEKGMTVFISHTGVHMDPEIYPNPRQFDPERFSPEQKQLRDPIAWLPFASGPRQCIGLRFAQMQMRIALALLIHNYKFSIVPETAEPKKYNPRRLIVAPLGGMNLKLEKIH